MRSYLFRVLLGSPGMPNINHSEWSLLRYNYYLGGRNLLLNCQYDAAGLLLAYSIELSFKHALNLCGETDPKILKDHSHPRLKNDLEKYADFQNYFKVSEDFLLFNEYYINSRYPSKKEEFNQKNNIEFHNFQLDYLAHYDDLMFQIDKKILETSADTLSSCFVRSYLNLDDSRNIYLIHGNFPFHSNISMLENYLKKIKDREKQLEELKIFYDSNKDVLWDCSRLPVRAGLISNGKANSKDFVWKKEFKAGETIVFNTSNLIHCSSK